MHLVNYVRNEVEFVFPKLEMKSWPRLGKDLTFDNSLKSEAEPGRWKSF